MKRILTSAAALALLIGTPALAQDRDHRDDNNKHDSSAPAHQAKPNGGGDHGPNGGHQDRGGDRGNHGMPASGGPNPYAGRGPVNPKYRGSGAYHAPAANTFDRGQYRNDRNFNPNNQPNRNPNWNANNNRNPNWNRQGGYRGPQQRPRTFDRRVYQRSFQAQHRYRGGFYRKPPGWYYRRWNYGQILPFAFFARDYWLNDYYDYDLMTPPYGYEWVRYGDDALLVDVRTGMILQVEYGVFY